MPGSIVDGRPSETFVSQDEIKVIRTLACFGEGLSSRAARWESSVWSLCPSWSSAVVLCSEARLVPPSEVRELESVLNVSVKTSLGAGVSW